MSGSGIVSNCTVSGNSAATSTSPFTHFGGGGTDKFRIKIWNTATSAIVYDNQMGALDSATPSAVIGGGSIVIQK